MGVLFYYSLPHFLKTTTLTETGAKLLAEGPSDPVCHLPTVSGLQECSKRPDFKNHFIFKNYVCACVSVCGFVHVSMGTLGGQEKVLERLELES